MASGMRVATASQAGNSEGHIWQRAWGTEVSMEHNGQRGEQRVMWAEEGSLGHKGQRGAQKAVCVTDSSLRNKGQRGRNRGTIGKRIATEGTV